jgi:uncharacterized short protein YbdD (DUF466 family)
MPRAWNSIKEGIAHFWQGLREWSGDAAYDKYRDCTARQGVEKALTPTEFYVERLNQKYSRPNRCC